MAGRHGKDQGDGQARARASAVIAVAATNPATSPSLTRQSATGIRNLIWKLCLPGYSSDRSLITLLLISGRFRCGAVMLGEGAVTHDHLAE